MTDKVVMLNTCGTREEAGRIARMLVERRLAACVNVAGPVRSVYRWNGAVEEAEEYLLIVKSALELLPRLRQAIEEAHSYELPEVIALGIVGGSERYLEWLGSGLEPEDDVSR